MRKKSMLTVDRLKELMRYEESTGIFYRIKSVRGSSIGSKVGTLRKDGYLITCIDKDFFYVHRLVYLYFNGVMPINLIDHIDGNRSNNKLENLRSATFSENLQNSKSHKDSLTGVKGVWQHKPNIWRAAICTNRKRKDLGLFKSLEDAQAAYKKAEEELHPFRK